MSNIYEVVYSRKYIRHEGIIICVCQRARSTVSYFFWVQRDKRGHFDKRDIFEKGHFCPLKMSPKFRFLFFRDKK